MVSGEESFSTNQGELALYESPRQMVASAELLAAFLPARITAQISEQGNEPYTVQTMQKILPDGSRLEYVTFNRPISLVTLKRPEGIYIIKDDRANFVATPNHSLPDPILAKLPEGHDAVEYQAIALNAVKNHILPVYPEVQEELSIVPQSIQSGELDTVPCYIVTSVLDLKSTNDNPDPVRKFVRYFRKSDLLLLRSQWITAGGILQSDTLFTYELEPADEDFALSPETLVVEYADYSKAFAAILAKYATPSENPEKIAGNTGFSAKIKRLFSSSDFFPWTAATVGILIVCCGALLHFGMTRAKKHS